MTLSADREELVLSNVGWAHKIAYSYRLIPREERRQEAVLALIIAAEHYDPQSPHARGFRPYAIRAIRTRLAALHNKIKRLGRTVDWTAIESGDEDAYDAELAAALLREETDYERVETRVDKKARRADFHAILALLDPVEKKFVLIKLRGGLQRDFAEEMGWSRATASRFVRDLRTKLVKLGVKP
jgi:RNA polymerase sigma factor (sigma-70 family)